MPGNTNKSRGANTGFIFSKVELFMAKIKPVQGILVGPECILARKKLLTCEYFHTEQKKDAEQETAPVQQLRKASRLPFARLH